MCAKHKQNINKLLNLVQSSKVLILAVFVFALLDRNKVKAVSYGCLHSSMYTASIPVTLFRYSTMYFCKTSCDTSKCCNANIQIFLLYSKTLETTILNGPVRPGRYNPLSEDQPKMTAW